MRITQKQENLKKERERIKLLKQIEESQKILKEKEVILQKQLENKEQINQIKANIEDLKNKVEETTKNNNRIKQITVINKSDLKSDVKEKKNDSETITNIKKDVDTVKRNIEDKLIRNELARQREEEIKKENILILKKVIQKKKWKRTKLNFSLMKI